MSFLVSASYYAAPKIGTYGPLPSMMAEAWLYVPLSAAADRSISAHNLTTVFMLLGEFLATASRPCSARDLT